MPTMSTKPQGDVDFALDELCCPCWDRLPDDLTFHIFSFLGASTLYKAGLVCKTWLRVAYDELLWKNLFYRHWHIHPSIPMAPGKTSWLQEYKRLYYHVPVVESEVLKEHGDQVLHVSFSHNGKMFATSSKDGFIRVWDTAYPTSLRFKADMRQFDWKYTQFSQFNESDTLLLVSGVHKVPHSTSGEIAVFSLEGEFVMQGKVMNKPYDVFGTWYNDCYLLSGNLHWTGHLNSCSALLLNKAERESMQMRLFRFSNTNASSIRTILVSNCLLEQETAPPDVGQIETDDLAMDVDRPPGPPGNHPEGAQPQGNQVLAPEASGSQPRLEAGLDDKKPVRRVQSMRVYENGCFCTKFLELDEEDPVDRLNGTIEYSEVYRQAETSAVLAANNAAVKESVQGLVNTVAMEAEIQNKSSRDSDVDSKESNNDVSDIPPVNSSVQYRLRGGATGVEAASTGQDSDQATADHSDAPYASGGHGAAAASAPDFIMEDMSVDSSMLSLDRTVRNSFCCVDYSGSRRERKTAGICGRERARPCQSPAVPGTSGEEVSHPVVCGPLSGMATGSGSAINRSQQNIVPASTDSDTPVCDKYLIFSKGSETYTPHQIGIKRIKPLKVFNEEGSCLLPSVNDGLQDLDPGGNYDEVDHLIDMHGHIIGMCLSPDHRYLYVNSRPWPKNYHIENPLYPPPIAQEIDIHVIDLQKIKEVGTMHRSHKAYTSNDECFFIFLDVCDEYVASGAEDRHGYLWDRHYGLCLNRYPHSDVVNSVAFNPQDPQVLVTVSDDFSIKIWRSLAREKEVVKAYNKEHCIRMEHVRAIIQNTMEDTDTTAVST